MYKYLAEFIGTFLLIFFGVGCILFIGISSESYIVLASEFALVMIVVASAIGKISGCHINPVVSLAMFLDKRITKKNLLYYILFQLIGAIAACLILAFIISQTGRLSFSNETALGYNGYNQLSVLGISVGGAFLIEIFLTFVFVLSVLYSTQSKKCGKYVPLVFGFVLFFVHIFGLIFTGTSVNPVRSLAPAFVFGLFSGNFLALSQVYVFIFSTIIGSLIAFLFYKAVLKNQKVQFLESIKNCIKKYFKVKGRSTRAEFWFFALLVIISNLCLNIFCLDLITYGSLVSLIMFIIFMLVNVFLIIPTITVTCRRLHDTGKSALFCFLALIPLIGIVFIIVLCSKKSDGDNLYGMAKN